MRLLCEPYLLATPLCRTSPLAWGSINAFLAFTKLQHAAAAKMKRNKQKRGGGKEGGWGGEEEKEAAETEKTKQMTRSCNFDINCSKCNSTRQCRRHLPRHPFPLCLPLIHASKSGNPSPCSGVSRRVSERLLLSRLRRCLMDAWRMPHGALMDVPFQLSSTLIKLKFTWNLMNKIYKQSAKISKI